MVSLDALIHRFIIIIIIIIIIITIIIIIIIILFVRMTRTMSYDQIVMVPLWRRLQLLSGVLVYSLILIGWLCF